MAADPVVAASPAERRAAAGKRKGEIVLAPLCEAGLLLVAGAAAVLLHRPFFFASLGPTAYEMTETPERQSARPYNVLMGHAIGVVAGFLALWVTHASSAPAVSVSSVTWPRVWAAVVATLLTVAGTILARATQPAALSTTLIVASGAMQQPVDGPIILGAIALITLIGEPLRRWRLRQTPQDLETLARRR